MASSVNANGGEVNQQSKEWQELMDAVYEISTILNTGLDRQALTILVNLCEAGVNPEALAMVVQELRKEAARIQQQEASTDSRDTTTMSTSGIN